MSCAPLLHHLGEGIDKLEKTMRAEKQQLELEQLIAKGFLHGTADSHVRGEVAETRTPNEVAETRTYHPATPEQNEARRRLIRLWSSANHAIVKGCCLQALQLLTGREVIRTHRHWRLFTKRMIWAGWEALRRRTGLTSFRASALSCSQACSYLLD